MMVDKKGRISGLLQFFPFLLAPTDAMDDHEEESSSGSGADFGGNKGLILFILATLFFIIAQIIGFNSFYVYASFLLMIYTSVFILGGNGLFFVIAFSIWYIFSGAYDFGTLKVWVLPIVLSSAAAHGVITSISGKGKFIPQAEQEILWGLLPITIFILDVGLVNWVLGDNNYVLPEVVRLILAWVPFWSYVGIAFMIKGGERGFLKTGAIVLSVIYVAGVILLVPGTVEGSTFIPSAEELAQVKQQSQQGVNPFLINVKCAFSEPTNMPVCVKRKSNDARYKKICQESGITDKAQLEACILEEERKEKEVGSVQGVASTIVTEATEVDFKEVDEEDFPRRSFQPRDIYPIILDVENPRREELRMGIGCIFKKGKENISGEVSIEGKKEDNFIVLETGKKTTIECTPSQDLDGTYDLEYSAALLGVNTPSYLKRAFIPEIESYQAQQDLKKEIESIEFPRNRDALSQAPEDFARLNFKFGSGTGSNPIISVDEDVRFSWGVENLARGKILRINGYSFDSLVERGFNIDASKVGDSDCLQGGNLLVPASKITALKSCWLQIPADLKGIEDYRVQTFAASFNYDYEMTHTIRNIRVEASSQQSQQVQTEGVLVS